MYILTFLAGMFAGASLLLAIAVFRDGARRNAHQDRIVADWLAHAEEREET